jgi:hypothetical protein
MLLEELLAVNDQTAALPNLGRPVVGKQTAAKSRVF